MEEADTDGRTILKSFVRYPLCESAALRDGVVLVPQQEQAATTMWYGFVTLHMLLLITPSNSTVFFFYLNHNGLFGIFPTIPELFLFLSTSFTDRNRLSVLIKVHLHCSNWLCDIATLLVQSFTISSFNS